MSLAIHYPDSRLQVNLTIYGGQVFGNSKPIIGTGTSKFERDLRCALKHGVRSNVFPTDTRVRERFSAGECTGLRLSNLQPER